MSEAKTIVDRFFEQMKEAAVTLSGLEARAVEVKAQQERMDAAHAEIEATETTIEQLRQERRELMRFYQEADFEDDISRKAKITKRRIAIDAEVKKLGKEIDRLSTVAEQNEPDAREVAALAVALDGITYPNPYDFAESLKRSLWPLNSELDGRTHEAKRKLPSYSHDAYQKAKYGDDGYEERERREALRGEKRGERYQKILRSNAREEAIAGASPHDRVSATVSDRPPLLEED